MSSASERRAKQTVRNLVFSMLATLGVVALIVLGVPRDDSSLLQRVDYQSVADEAKSSLAKDVLAPSIPESWWSNAARIEKQLGLDVWYVGFVTEDSQFLALTQSFNSNPSWESDVLAGNSLAGTKEIAGLSWEIYPTRTPSDPPGTKELAMLYRTESWTVVIYGTAAEADFEVLAEAIAAQLGK